MIGESNIDSAVVNFRLNNNLTQMINAIGIAKAKTAVNESASKNSWSGPPAKSLRAASKMRYNVRTAEYRGSNRMVRHYLIAMFE